MTDDLSRNSIGGRSEEEDFAAFWELELHRDRLVFLQLVATSATITYQYMEA